MLGETMGDFVAANRHEGELFAAGAVAVEHGSVSPAGVLHIGAEVYVAHQAHAVVVETVTPESLIVVVVGLLSSVVT